MFGLIRFQLKMAEVLFMGVDVKGVMRRTLHSIWPIQKKKSNTF